jgi:hypothetical protein
VDCTTSTRSLLINPIDYPGTSLIEKLRTTGMRELDEQPLRAPFLAVVEPWWNETRKATLGVAATTA